MYEEVWKIIHGFCVTNEDSSCKIRKAVKRRGDMMFDKDLFLSLCEKYDVELSKTAMSPMLKDGDQAHAITNDDVNRVFAPCQTYFDYSCNKTNAKVEVPVFYLQEDYAVAC